MGCLRYTVVHIICHHYFFYYAKYPFRYRTERIPQPLEKAGDFLCLSPALTEMKNIALGLYSTPPAGGFRELFGFTYGDPSWYPFVYACNYAYMLKAHKLFAMLVDGQRAHQNNSHAQLLALKTCRFPDNSQLLLHRHSAPLLVGH